jgi:putative hydrolase of the HAD superfamily
VLTTAIGPSFAAFAQEHGVSADAMRAILEEAYADHGSDSLVARLELGEATEEEFETWLAGKLSEGLDEPLDPAGITAKLFAGSLPDHEMIDAVRRARAAGVRTGLVSNSWGGHLYDADLMDELFDAVVISGRVGLRKPDPRIYAMAAQMIGLEPADCVFVDDLEQNADGARAAGMEAIVHRNAEGTVPKLEALLGIALR